MVNVSAPEGSRLDYEGESYRITRALSERCRFVPTELGTLDDLVETVRAEQPTAIHFSGHGAPGALVFEDEEGREDVVSIDDSLPRCARGSTGRCRRSSTWRAATATTRGAVEEPESSAGPPAPRGGAQVVGYYGPIVDELSTRAEVAFYRALAEGEPTRYAVRQAREALASPFWALDCPPQTAICSRAVRAAPIRSPRTPGQCATPIPSPGRSSSSTTAGRTTR